jgi:hypothetical protein
MTSTIKSNEFPTKHKRRVFQRTQTLFSVVFELNLVLQKGLRLRILSLLISNNIANGALHDAVQ